ncbi:autotransporter domain-containing protein [Rhodopseudomonas palustris]|uniref:autotransporter-associated beta strand repeat-containing protein n=1 Tax=Rhodopseudomonas palustris TaxID=1076 RepID=UPI002ACEF2A6|nr:autotransporter-associated beta strand repeat-containing protein [Rhodopseudomonas palustris]WQH01537.1 autotransporter domain-containing protein [Rhodopseudomonas palustris]
MATTALLSVAQTAHAQQVWTGATSQDYDTASNWSGPVVPDAGATATFTSNGAPTSVVLTTIRSPAGFTFDAGTPTYTIGVASGGQLNMSGAGIVNNSGNAQEFLIGSGSQIDFVGFSTAGNATIRNLGGTLIFSQTSSGGTAAIENDGSMGLRTTSGSISIGSLSGSGTVAAIAAGVPVQSLSIGSLNTSTEFSGTFSDGDSQFALVKTGTGTLTLTGNNFYSGGTTISGGTLQLGNGGLNGSIIGDIINNATLAVDLSNGTSLGGVISGSGELVQRGGGILALLGNNTYTGGTTISSGTLRVGNGATSGSIVGDVVNNSVLQFNRSDAIGFGGVISGSGELVKLAGGTLTLTGANTYTGGTTISNGTLQIGSGGTTGSITGNITNNAALVFNRSDAIGFGGVISGTGSVTKLGSDALLLFGENTYTGGTTISGGFLQIGSGGTAGSIVGDVVNNGTLEFARSDAHAFSGAISGTGNLISFGGSVGSGVFTLTGTNTYSGGTTVSSGTLQIGDGGTSGSIVGNVSNNATLAFNRSDATSFGGVISGGGQVVKRGAGDLSLTGLSSYTGATTVDAGTLSVNGSIASSSLTTVNAGAALGGTGTVGTTLINGGALAPGNSIGTLNVSGNLVFTAASSYMVEVSPSSADRTNVSGTATLGGATVNASFASGGYVERQYTIVNATGGVVGTFGALVNTNLPSGFKSSLGYDANNAYLNLVLDYTPTPPTPEPSPTPPVINSGLNGNQTQVANALSGYFARNGSIPIVFGALGPAGLSAASGETPTGAQQSTFNAMGMFMGVLTDPFSNGRGPADQTPVAMSYAAGGTAGRGGSAHDAHAIIIKAVKPTFEPRWVSWGAGFGGSQTTDGNATLGSATSTSRLYGIAAGADYWLSPQTVAGFAMAGGATSFGLSGGLGSGRSDLIQAGGFVRHRVGAFYLTAAAAYGWQDITTERTLGVGGINQLRANFNANAYSARVEAGHRFVAPLIGGIGLTPYAAGQVTAFDLPAYAEQTVSGNGVFALDYAAKTATTTRSEIGLRSDKSFALDGVLLTLRGRAAWAHDFDVERSIAATFQALPGASFVVNGARPARDAALTTVSAEVNWLNGFSVAAAFEGEFSDVTRSYAGKGVLRYAW